MRKVQTTRRVCLCILGVMYVHACGCVCVDSPLVQFVPHLLDILETLAVQAPPVTQLEH